MGWKRQGPPHQLQVAGEFVTKAGLIAKHMIEFFIGKVDKIRKGISKVAVNLSVCINIMKNKN